ncbi:hypothetical protein CJ179_33280 [Rhodococcus sp. ACS1]|uniref:DUF5994 family protein n=1 Tax=Rhodococcus sp. ACS1 TaxID=2028570 RepID=UPI000BB12B5B|nr:DUF5994 family protein [Rhodococcus sp. ACS1]PBC40184.1 hypothetical protein CJ179_33280 [Rhodococcus sp. ACS1]
MKHETNPTYSGRGLGLFHPTSDGAQPFDEPTRTPRLLLRARDDHSAGVDGAWWPRTTNLTTELHDLISVLADRVGTTEQVSFDWNSMSVSQRGIDRPDGVRVSGPLPDQPPDIMYVFGTDGRRWELLVIAPMTDADGAFDTMQKAVGVDPR